VALFPASAAKLPAYWKRGSTPDACRRCPETQMTKQRSRYKRLFK
jgi:hypothetical protein